MDQYQKKYKQKILQESVINIIIFLLLLVLLPYIINYQQHIQSSYVGVCTYDHTPFLSNACQSLMTTLYCMHR